MQRLKAKLAMVIPVMAAALLGLVLSNLTMTDPTPVKASPFDEVERMQRSMVAEVTNASDMAADPEPVAKQLERRAGGAGFQPKAESGECVCDCDCLDEKDIRKIVSDEFNNQKLAEAVAPRAYGASAVPAIATTYSQPAITYSQAVSQPVYRQSAYNQSVYSQPKATTTVRRGILGRRTVTYQAAPAAPVSSGVCRVVNGQVICSQ